MNLKLLIPSVILALLFGCSPENKQNDIDPGERKNSASALTGKVYFYAPAFDSLNCQAVGDCDCCSGYVVFVNDSQFVLIDHCEASSMYYKGTYRFVRENLIISSDSIFVTREIAEHTDMDKDRQYHLTYSVWAPFSQRWKGFRCQDKLCFMIATRDRQYVSPDPDHTAEDVIDQLKTDGVWKMLEVETTPASSR